jgi:DUF1365 family protein
MVITAAPYSTPVLAGRACVYDVEIGHLRPEPMRYGFTNRIRSWLVDLSAPPSLPRGFRWLANFSAADHLGPGDCSIRENVERYLHKNGIDVRGGQVLMLAQPRVLGYAFNPLSLHWCHYPDGTLAAVIAEVHNTYGERHCYLIHPDEAGRASAQKAFYVSPFYPVEGRYQMSVPEPGETLSVTMTLHRTEARPFVASMRGRRQPRRRGLLYALRTPLATRAVMFHIKRHGITLYVKGLRPSPRPTHMPQPGVQ